MVLHVRVACVAGRWVGRLSVVVLLLALSCLRSEAQADGSTGLQVETGLMSFFTGERRSIRLTVTELGPRAGDSLVRVVYRDADGRVVARDDARLRRSSAAVIDVPLTMSEPLVQVRATVTITGRAGRQSVPVVVLEDVDHGSFTIEQRVSCAPPASREGPVMPFCPEVVVTTLTAGL